VSAWQGGIYGLMAQTSRFNEFHCGNVPEKRAHPKNSKVPRFHGGNGQAET
jgi:hypothetical protein